MRSDKKLTIGLNRLTPELLLPSSAASVRHTWSSMPSTPSPTPGSAKQPEQHHTDDFLRSTMKLFLLVTPPAARMQVSAPCALRKWRASRSPPSGSAFRFRKHAD